MKNGSQIFELYGYPVDSWSSAAQVNLSHCNCPFMCAECDGGGNRFSSAVKLKPNHPLKKFFKRKTQVQSGVCSLQLHPGEQPWIVCPRRLLNYRKTSSNDLQTDVKNALHVKSELTPGMTYSVWSEVKMKCLVSNGVKEGLFDYTFDYVITGTKRQSLAAISKDLGIGITKVKKLIVRSGLTLCHRDGELYCDNFPALPLVIVEVMTSSTCGGNKKDRTQIAQVFEDTILRLNGQPLEPQGPAINYRQVWARMVSQMLVKSQIGIAWGGTTFWVLQDLLADYISKTTALNLSEFLSEHKGEVNIISGGYGKNVDPRQRENDFALIQDVKLYSGPIANGKSEKSSFSDIIKLGAAPDISELWKKLIQKSPCATFSF